MIKLDKNGKIPELNYNNFINYVVSEPSNPNIGDCYVNNNGQMYIYGSNGWIEPTIERNFMDNETLEIGDKFVSKYNDYFYITDIEGFYCSLKYYNESGFCMGNILKMRLNSIIGEIKCGDLTKIDHFPWEKTKLQGEIDELIDKAENPVIGERSEPKHKCICTHSFFNSSKGCTCGGI